MPEPQRPQLPRGAAYGAGMRLAGPVPRGHAGDAQLRCGVMAVARQPREVDFFTPQYALVYMYAGTGWYTDRRGRRWRLRAGSVFQRLPGMSHHVEYTSPNVRCYIAVPRQIFELVLLVRAGAAEPPVFEIGNQRGIVVEFSRIARALERCSARELFSVMQRMQSLIVTIHSLRRDTESAADARIAKAMQLLSEHVDSRTALPELARSLNMSYSTFRQRFATLYGLSPRAFLVRRRIESAIAMLRQRDRTLKEIADELGYSDVYAFAAQFKKIMGSPPGKFRAAE